jgi:hypothetical protein
MFSLINPHQELANPLVANNIHFYPHYSGGKDINGLYQSAKWREDLSPDFRVQMVSFGSKHFYIYEPVTLRGKDQLVLVPAFFYEEKNILCAKCIRPKYAKMTNGMAIYVPKNIDFNHPDLMTVQVADFDLIYSEIVTVDGTPLVERCGHQIFGRSSSPSIFNGFPICLHMGLL